MIIASKKFIISLLATFYFVGVFVNNDEKFVSCFQPPQHKKSTTRIRITTSMATSMATITTVTSTKTNTFPPIPVLFESSRVLIIHKPHGIGHHDESSTLSSSDHQQQEKPGILQILRHQRREVKEDEDDDNNDKDSEYENEERLYGIHRLDKVTSGILVFAKDSTTASILSKYFQEKKIQKIYFGVSSKKSLKKKQGLVQGGMERSRNKGWILVHNKKNSNNNKKKKSITTATAAAPPPTTTRHNNFAKTRFFTTSMNSTNIINNSKNDKSNDDDDDNVVKTAVMFRPYTGKTHQLRVAAKSMGIPLLGDPIYKDGGNGGNSTTSTSTSSSRTMLHASGIQIPAFLDHNEINIWCPPTFFDDNDDDIIDDDDDPAESRILSDTLDKAVEKLMTKNCDVDGILEAMKLTNKMKRNAQSITQ